MCLKFSFARTAYLVCKWSLSIALLTPLANWAQGIWVATKNDRSIYLIPTMHTGAFAAKWKDDELNLAISTSEVAYIENTGLRFDLNNFPDYAVPEYANISENVKAKLETGCASIQESPKCYKTWHPFMAYAVILNSMGSVAPYQVGHEYHVITRLIEKKMDIRPLEDKEDMFSIVSKSSNIAIIESTNLHGAASEEDLQKFLTESTQALVDGDAMAMQKKALLDERTHFSGDFYEHLVIDRTRNMAARVLSDLRKSIIVLAGFGHFFSRKDNFFSLLEDQGFTITKLNAE